MMVMLMMMMMMMKFRIFSMVNWSSVTAIRLLLFTGYIPPPLHTSHLNAFFSVNIQ